MEGKGGKATINASSHRMHRAAHKKEHKDAFKKLANDQKRKWAKVWNVTGQTHCSRNAHATGLYAATTFFEGVMRSTAHEDILACVDVANIAPNPLAGDWDKVMACKREYEETKEATNTDKNWSHGERPPQIKRGTAA
eukprot:9483683-Pyramimonas_sp.AAC.1